MEEERTQELQIAADSTFTNEVVLFHVHTILAPKVENRAACKQCRPSCKNRMPWMKRQRPSIAFPRAVYLRLRRVGRGARFRTVRVGDPVEVGWLDELLGGFVGLAFVEMSPSTGDGL